MFKKSKPLFREPISRIAGNGYTQGEYLIKAVLITSGIPVFLVTIGAAIFTLAGSNVVGSSITNWLELLTLNSIILIGLLMVWQKRFGLARYLVVVIFFGFSIWGTLKYGISSIAVLGYVITMILAFLTLPRSSVILALIIAVPVILFLLFPAGVARSRWYLLAHVTLMVMIGFLLGFYRRVHDQLDRDLSAVNKVEAAQQAGFSVIETRDLQETISRILEELKNVIPHDSASVLLLRDEGYLEIVGGSGWDHPEEVIGMKFLVPGDNPNSVVIVEERPHILANAPDDFPTFREEPHNHIQSWLGVPLIANHKVIGMVAIDSSEPGFFSELQVDVVTSFAGYVAIAIENAQLFEIANLAVNRRSILYRASQKVIRAGADLEAIYSTIHDAACQLMACEAFVITLLDEKEEFIDGAYMIDRGGRVDSVRIPLGEGLSGQVIKTGKPVFEDDLLALDNPVGEHFGHEDEVRSLVAVPFSIGDKVIGMLSAQSYQPGEYGREELELLELLAAQAGVAIENARLLVRLEYIATTDSMTNLRNRRAFDDLLAKEVNRAERYHQTLSLLILDIDDFKQFNDLYGHSRGDEHLAALARLMVEGVRDGDIICRIGGEEFGIILPHTNQLGALDLAERIRVIVESAFRGKVAAGGTVSIGVAEYPTDADSLEGLFGIADLAMFQVKNKGKNNASIFTKNSKGGTE